MVYEKSVSHRPHALTARRADNAKFVRHHTANQSLKNDSLALRPCAAFGCGFADAYAL